MSFHFLFLKCYYLDVSFSIFLSLFCLFDFLLYFLRSLSSLPFTPIIELSICFIFRVLFVSLMSFFTAFSFSLYTNSSCLFKAVHNNICQEFFILALLLPCYLFFLLVWPLPFILRLFLTCLVNAFITT